VKHSSGEVLVLQRVVPAISPYNFLCLAFVREFTDRGVKVPRPFTPWGAHANRAPRTMEPYNGPTLLRHDGDTMPVKNLDSSNLEKTEDWAGNNAAFTCPVCAKVFIVSQVIHGGERKCPDCGQSTARLSGSRRRGDATATLEW